MSDPTITVGIPTKNEAATIGQTLHALNEQTRPPDHVLLADDSDDETAYKARVTAAKMGFDLETFTVAGGVGAAREAIRERAAPGLLVCLDAEVEIPPDWLENHVEIHDAWETPAVISGAWPGSDVVYTEVIDDPMRDEYFIEGNCSMTTATAEKIGGWDPTFSRGCDWDFRVRLSQTLDVDAVCSTRVAARPMDSNSGGWLHVRKQLARPSSVPYLRKYGRRYLGFHPAHVAGDGLGVSALAALLVAPVYPPAVAWAVGCMAAYAAQNGRHGYTAIDRLVSSLAVFALGTSTLRAVVSQ